MAELLQLLFDKIKGTLYSKHQSLKFCAGMKHFREKKIYFDDASVGIRPANLDSAAFIESLVKSAIKCRLSNSKIAFATILLVNFENIPHSCIASGLVKKRKYSAEDLAVFQNSITARLDLFNSEVVEINKLERVWTIE